MERLYLKIKEIILFFRGGRISHSILAQKNVAVNNLMQGK